MPMALFNHSVHVPSTQVCMQEYLLLFISLDVVSHWPQIKDSNRLPRCASMWRVVSTKYDGVPWAPLLLFLGFITIRTVITSDCFKWKKCIQMFFFFIILQNKWLWPTNQSIYLFIKERGYCRAHCFSSFEVE